MTDARMDARMDARLRAAGERWRDATDAADGERVEPAELQPPVPHRSHRVLAMVSAAVVVVAVAIGGAVLAARQDSGGTATAAGTPAALQNVTWTDEASGATMVFLPHAVRTFDGCSNGLRAVTVSASTIRLGASVGVASTCTMPIFKTSALDRVLRAGLITWSVSDSALRLSARGVTATLTSDGQRPPSVTDQKWTLQNVSGNSRAGAYPATLTFDASNGFTATDTCASVSGSVHTTLTTLVFSNVAVSANGCITSTPARPVVDTLLTGTTRYEIRGDELILSRPNYGGMLVYRAVPPAEALPAQLTTGHWMLVGIAFGHGAHASSAAPVVESVLTFARGAFTATHRCRDQTGQVVAHGSSLTITDPHAVNDHSCPDVHGPQAGLMTAEERAVDRILSGSVGWSVSGDQLVLSHVGVGTLVFQHH